MKLSKRGGLWRAEYPDSHACGLMRTDRSDVSNETMFDFCRFRRCTADANAISGTQFLAVDVAGFLRWRVKLPSSAEIKREV